MNDRMVEALERLLLSLDEKERQEIMRRVGARQATAGRRHLLDIPRNPGPGITGGEIDRRVREERSSWDADR